MWEVTLMLLGDQKSLGSIQLPHVDRRAATVALLSAPPRVAEWEQGSRAAGGWGRERGRSTGTGGTSCSPSPDPRDPTLSAS